MTTDLMTYVDNGKFIDLFQELGWDLPPSGNNRLIVITDDGVLTVSPVADQSGLRVWVCATDSLPNAAAQRAVDVEVSKHSQVRLLIFTDGIHQSWRWPRRGATASTNSKLLRHTYTVGDMEQREDLGRRLAKIELPMDEHIGIAEIQDLMAQAFNEEAVKRSTEASQHMERMNQILLDAGCSTDTASSLLVRLLFLFFGDDTQMWPDDTFQKWVIDHTTADNLHIKLTELFTVLCDEELDKAQTAGGLRKAEGKYAGTEYQNFRRIDGMYQEQVPLPPLSENFRQKVLVAGEFDWGKVNPDIFGAMFQQLVNPEELRENGEHYTSEENIQKVIDPLFLDEYRRRFQDCYGDRTKLLALQDELAGLQFMDPACGCGNFLIQAYKHLRGLEYELIRRAEELELEEIQSQLAEIEHQRMSKNKKALIARRDEIQAGTSLQFDDQVLRKSKLSMRQFYGIEVNAWPAKVASTAMLLVDHLANQTWGENVVRLPIEETPNIVHEDALSLDWANVFYQNPRNAYIFGNPPFRGGLKLDDKKAESRNRLYESIPESKGLRVGRIDYVCAWFAKAAQFARDYDSEVAFVATNSITQGEQARVMGPLMSRLKVGPYFGYRTFKWDSDAKNPAAVHVVIIGFAPLAKLPEKKILVDELGMRTNPKDLNWWISPAPHVEVSPRGKPFREDLPRMTVGSQPTDGGHLLLSQNEADELRSDPIAAPFIRRYMGAKELLNDQWKGCLWLDGQDVNYLLQSPEIARRLELVKAKRDKSPTASFRKTPPHIFTHRKHPGERYIALPQNSTDSRQWIPSEVFDEGTVASNKATIVYPVIPWVYGFFHSQMYQTWIRAVGGRLKSDPTITADLAFNSFPWPETTIEDEKAIADLMQEVLEVRDPLRSHLSLGALYSQETMPSSLRQAHTKLDAFVDGLYSLSDPDQIEREKGLFQRYKQLSGQ